MPYEIEDLIAINYALQKQITELEIDKSRLSDQIRQLQSTKPEVDPFKKNNQALNRANKQLIAQNTDLLHYAHTVQLSNEGLKGELVQIRQAYQEQALAIKQLTVQLTQANQAYDEQALENTQLKETALQTKFELDLVKNLLPHSVSEKIPSPPNPYGFSDTLSSRRELLTQSLVNHGTHSIINKKNH